MPISTCPSSPVPRIRVAALRLDPNFTPLLDQAAEEVRRRVITIFTNGDGGVVKGDGTAASPGAENGGDGAPPAASVAGLASVVEMQEREIGGLREQLLEALSRVPHGGKDGGGMSALEEALRNRVRNVARCGVQGMSRGCWHAPADRTTTSFSG